MDAKLSEVLRRAPAPIGTAALAEAALDSLQALRQAVVDADWAQTRLHAHAAAAWGKELLELAGRSTAAPVPPSSVASRVRELAQSRHRAVLSRYAAALRSDHPELASRYADALDALAAGAAEDQPLLASFERTSMAAERIPLIEETAVAAVVRGLQGQVHDTFQRVVDANPTLDAIATRIEEPLREIVRAEASWVRSGQLEFYGSRTPSAAADVAMRLLPRLAERSVALAPVLARAWRAAETLRAAGKGGASERIGMLSAEGSGVLREFVATFAAAAYIRATANQGGSTVAELIRNAPGTAFEARLPDGRNTELARLPSTADGSVVEVGGFVEELVVDRDEKLVSRATVHDPSSDTTAVLAIAFTHLPHRGFVRGAYVRAHGLYRASSVLNDGSPAVEIERMSLAQIARESWRIGLLRLGSPWFERWPNGAHIEWSLGPHRLPAEENAEPDCGACELVFAPLTRGDV